MDERIDFYCANPDHQTGELAEGITVHQERWAYCPCGKNNAHTWQPTGGTTLVQLKRRLADALRSQELKLHCG